MEDGAVNVQPRNQSKDARSKWGMSRTMISNIMEGVKNGFERKLEINGVGYRAAMQGKNIQLSLGYSHEVVYNVPEGDRRKCPKPTEIVLNGIDKQKLGQVAAEIREFRPPGALQGQGREICGRDDHPQRRQEEVRITRHGKDQRIDHAPRAARSPPDQEGRQRAPAPFGASFVEEHLCAGHRRQPPAARWPRPRRWKAT
jgi:ribosomal protein L6P/L9E